MNKDSFLSSAYQKHLFTDLYGSEERTVKEQQHRYKNLIGSFNTRFQSNPERIYSTPGRIEIGGNHTDHNHGRVLAASINLDAIAAVQKTGENKIVLYSEGYDKPFIVDLSQLNSRESEKGDTSALLRGISGYFNNSGYKIGGFNAYVESKVLPGSGLSSSASIEVLTGTILNDLYNDNSISPAEIAIAGQYAENNYFGKPCGLMDQLTCAHGGIVTIDFRLPEKPVIEKLEYDFQAGNFHIVVINTGGSHADLTQYYAAIPGEMKKIAMLLNKTVCRGISSEQIITNIKSLRKKAGDRAILRALHFISENIRVRKQVDALKKGNLTDFLNLVAESGNSSWKWLQNTYAPHKPEEQGITLALTLTEQFLKKSGQGGACRVHGGGFAGTILAFIPFTIIEEYSLLMQKVFGEDSMNILLIRNKGTMRVWP